MGVRSFLPAPIVSQLARLRAVADRRKPDFIVGGADNPYLRRWWLIPRNRIFNVYLHHFMRSDDDRALHDHPWWNVSILLVGSYVEMVPADPRHPAGALLNLRRRAGDIVVRRAAAAHRIMLDTDWAGRPYPVWTLFLTGPRIREWGFWCPKGWKHWKDFTAYRSKGSSSEVGPGCDEGAP